MARILRSVSLLLLVTGLSVTAIGDEKQHPVAATPVPELPMLVPATVPGPALAHAELLAGSLPSLAEGDGSTISEIPTPMAPPYENQPEDVFDSLTLESERTYVLIRAIDSGSGRVGEGDPGFVKLAQGLVSQAPGWDTWRVEAALVGKRERAQKYLAAADRLRARDRGVTELPSTQGAPWTLRSSVDNLYSQALRAAGLSPQLEGNLEVGKILQAATRMAEVGRTGKEDGAGWRKARDLLDRARLDGNEKASLAERVEVLGAACQDILHVCVEFSTETSRMS